VRRTSYAKRETQDAGRTSYVVRKTPDSPLSKGGWGDPPPRARGGVPFDYKLMADSFLLPALG